MTLPAGGGTFRRRSELRGYSFVQGNRGRNRIVIKAEAAVRLAMWRLLSGRLPLYLVSEYPKSGGTWFSSMLAEYLEVPFPRNRFPAPVASVMHGHNLWHASYCNAFCVLRDGRDVVVSSYFHHVIGNDRVPDHVVARNRAAMGLDDPSDVRRHLPAYIDYLFEKHDRTRFRFTWAEFIQSWISRGVGVVRYERLLEDPVGEMGDAIERVLGRPADRDRLGEIAERHSFRNVARRRPGEENPRSFLRKGVAGDWKEKFTPAAREAFDRHAGEELVLAGYVEDRSWVRDSA